MRPLAGIRVLDLSRLLPGPFATLVLADLGAPVDKIEDTGGGDYLRHMPPHVAGESAAFQLLNRGKRSARARSQEARGARRVRSGCVGYVRRALRAVPSRRARRGSASATTRCSRRTRASSSARSPATARPGRSRSAPATTSTTSRAPGVLGAPGPRGRPAAGARLPARRRERRHVVRHRHPRRARRARSHRQGPRRRRRDDRRRPRLRHGDASAPALAGRRGARGARACSPAASRPYKTYATKDGHAMTLGALEPKFWMAFCAGAGLEPRMRGAHARPAPGRAQDGACARRSRKRRATSGSRSAPSTTAASSPSRRRRSSRRIPHLRRASSSSTSRRRARPDPADPHAGHAARRDVQPAAAPGEHTRDVLRDAGFSEDEIDELLRAQARSAKVSQIFRSSSTNSQSATSALLQEHRQAAPRTIGLPAQVAAEDLGRDPRRATPRGARRRDPAP